MGDVIADQNARDLWQRVARLPQGERLAVLFYYRQEMRLLEVAEVLGVTAGTVKTLLHRARKKLRRDLEENQGRESNAFEILGPMSLIETLSLTLFMVGFFGLSHFDTTKADTQL